MIDLLWEESTDDDGLVWTAEYGDPGESNEATIYESETWYTANIFDEWGNELWIDLEGWESLHEAKEACASELESLSV